MEVNKTGRGQVVDLAQYEAVAQTQGNCLPLYTGEGVAYGHTGNKAPGFQPYDTFQCLDGWVFIGCLGPVMFARVARLLGLDPAEYTYEACSKDASAVNSDRGRDVDRLLRDFCANRTTLDVAAVPVVQARSHLPVVVDPSHAAGRSALVVPLARAARRA